PRLETGPDRRKSVARRRARTERGTKVGTVYQANRGSSPQRATNFMLVVSGSRLDSALKSSNPRRLAAFIECRLVESITETSAPDPTSIKLVARSERGAKP